MLPRISCIALCAVLLGGCFSQGAVDTPSILFVFLGAGGELVYAPQVGYPILESHLTIRTHGGVDPRLDYEYRHPARPEFDADVILVLGKDGSLQESTFGCAPNFPAASNNGCDAHLAGYSNANGVVGGMFGITLLAGSSYDTGIIERPFLAGTRWVNGTFKVTEVASRVVEISAGDEETQGLPYAIAELTNPISNCSIFTGKVRLDLRTGVAESCLVADSEGEYGWRLVSAAGLTRPTFNAEIPAWSTAGGAAKLPGLQDDDKLPFGFYQALSEASASNAEIADFLTRNPHLAESVMGFSGGQSTGDCATVCLRTQQWFWQLQLEVENDRLSFRITKTIEQPGNIERFAVTNVAFTDAPYLIKDFPATIASLGTVWAGIAEDQGFQPYTIHYFTSLIGPQHSILEPFMRVLFNGPEEEPMAPFVVFDSSGSIALWQAAGAQSSAFIDSCACAIPDVCC